MKTRMKIMLTKTKEDEKKANLEIMM
jgi:hypothetical protein